MCGIIGYIGKSKITKVLLDGLKRMEYRGYDSSGICVSQDNQLILVKRKGKIAELESAQELSSIKANYGIAHTRWATHGKPNETNAHPHIDMDKDIAIVHNGIIENYQAIRELLAKDGVKFSTETDSETIAHLIKKFYDGNLEMAVKKAMEILEGAYGIAVIHKSEEKIVVARKGSPLVIGIGEGEMFVASDVSAILDKTKNIIYLDDLEYAVLTADSYKIKHLNGDHVDKKVHEIKWSIDQIEKKGYKHFMLKEIFEQADSIENTLRGRIKDGKIKLDIDLDVSSIKRIIVTACGTSWHSALIAKYLMERICKIPVEVDYASEFRYRDPLVNETDLMIALSQSGETADTLAAIREAKEKGAKTFGIVNVVGSTISREVDEGMYLHAGPEIGVASTKAFTTQVADLLLLSLYFKQQKDGSVDEKIINDLTNLTDKINLILEKSDEIKFVAEKIKDFDNMLYLGRGLNFPVALEGALKLKEISYVHAEGYPAAEMKHGPIALIDKKMPVIFVAPNDNTYDKIISNMQEVNARGGSVIAVVNGVDDRISKLSDYIIKIPNCCEEVMPLLSVIPLQLLAYHVADIKGLDVDKPRNLAKAVTVE